MKTLIVVATFSLVCLVYAASAFAIANVSLSAAPDGKTWTLQASNFENIAGASIIINYDKSVVANPRVTQGAFVSGGAVLASNPNQPGVINLGIITTQTLNGSGPVATIVFERKTTGDPKLTISPQLYGQDLSAKAVITGETKTGDGTGETGNPSGGSSGSGYQGGSGSATPAVIGGTVTMPSDMNQPDEKKTQQPPPEYKEEPSPEGRAAAKEAAPLEGKAPEAEVKAPGPKVVPPVNVLERFKAYKGEMTSHALLALFTPDEKATVKQEPAILLADGKANLKVTIQNPQGKQAPNFALKKAKLVNLKMNPDSAWVVVARPAKDAYEASITMLVDDTAVEIPLVVAPKVDMDLDKSGKVDEKDFQLFLKERGSDKAPKHDLNKDGRRDYIDNYIFAANFLAMQAKAKEKPVSTKTPEKSTGGNQQVVPAENSKKK